MWIDMTIYKDDELISAYYNEYADLKCLKSMILDLCMLYFKLEEKEMEENEKK